MESQNYCHLPDLLLLTVHFLAWIFLVPSNLARGGFLLKYWPWVLCGSAMFADEEWAWGLSRKTITVLSPSPTTFQLETLLSVSRAFRAVSAVAGSPATGILKRVTDQTCQQFQCPPCRLHARSRVRLQDRENERQTDNVTETVKTISRGGGGTFLCPKGRQ